MDGRVGDGTRDPRVPKNFHPHQKSRYYQSPKKKFRVPFLLWRLVYNGIALLQRVCMDYGFPRAMDLDFPSRCVWSSQ